ncbi:PEP-CTERM sorting domain-containing protein [Sulfurirhabdus autotrophica]|uniref:Putative secreted protein with PEP-CTERM sorting signal n=1 Tax=Sulfurirhabdus autotrophica TaxID=1706046 RepID=A0A4R3XSJ4_9PROT|nr:PEP-CTERM sorting domain-containing protein [Sulfurirhabdus autotrophica]TCV80267.1 putative secreted protein with PEP-CTERM sorting signal [Sulfurirhabdus autotrophica]
MSIFYRAVMVIGILITFNAGSAFAVPFTPTIDEFWIVKGSAAAGPSEIFRDSFNNGIPPPSGPDGATTYSLYGSAGMTSESGGRLTMTPSLGGTTLVTNTYADLTTNALRLVATSPTNASFLGVASSFEIHGLFDMANLPTVSGQSFGISATDRAVGLGNLGNDIYSLFIGVSGNTGDVVVGLRHNDNTTNLSTVIDAISIQSLLSNAVQIELMLSKALDASQLTASYILYNGSNGILGSGSVGSNNVLSIYDGENYIRAAFQSTDRITVPEPSTLLLLGLGAAGLSFVRRRSTHFRISA